MITPIDVLDVTHILSGDRNMYPMGIGDTILIDGVVYEVVERQQNDNTCSGCDLFGTGICGQFRCTDSISIWHQMKAKTIGSNGNGTD